MMGYCREIGSPQRRQRPFNNSHETTGMLSRHAMGCLQRGHVDGGLTSDMSAGSRTMHTFKKLPRQSPRIAAATRSVGSTATRHLVEQNARRHGDVERLRALRQRNRHALRGDGVELRADPRALVSDVAGVLHPVDHERHGLRPGSELGHGPASRLDHGHDALGRLRLGQLSERAGADLLHRDRVPLQFGHELHTPRRARPVGSDQGALERQARGECLLHQSHAFDQREAAPAARLAALEIADRRWQITGDGSPRAFPAATGPSICREAADGRYVKIALTIAGSDSGGGAGIQADLKTFHQFGVFGTSVITAVTAQNTVGVLAWEPVSEALVTRQLDALAADLPPAAVKSGMLASAALVEAVAAGITRHRLPNYVLDPVMVATSGDRLLDRDAERLVARRLVPLATVVTPNLDEAAALVGGEVRTPDDMERAGRALVQLGARAALVKGGHLVGDVVVDVLIADGIARRFTRPRLETTSTHGTGCTLSAAVAAGLALGRPLERAVEDALDFVHRAIAAAPGLGQGHGPLNHFVPAPPRPPTDGL